MDCLKESSLVPVEKGCFVSQEANSHLGIVEGQKAVNGITYVRVNWGGNGQAKYHRAKELRSGFYPGFVIQDRPISNTRKTLGVGTVRATRRIAGRDLVLIQLHNTGEIRWVPYENLVRLKDARIKYERAEAPELDSSERFRLKALAYALDSWNQVTGALDRLDVDPLPHQIDIVHRIMTSDKPIGSLPMMWDWAKL